MSIFVVFKVARQIQGEYVVVQTLGAFKSATEAEQLTKQYSRGVELVPTPDGNVECFCEIGLHQTELVGD